MTEITTHRIARRGVLLGGCVATVLAVGAMPGLAATSTPATNRTLLTIATPIPVVTPIPVATPITVATPIITIDGHPSAGTSAKGSDTASGDPTTNPAANQILSAGGGDDKGSVVTTTSTANADHTSSTSANGRQKGSGDSGTIMTDGKHKTGSSPKGSTPAAGSLPKATTPTAGRTLTVAPAQGNVRVTLAGSTTSIPLIAAATVPMGSIIDATQGTVTLTDVRRGASLQTATFWGASFVVAQHVRSHDVTEVRLVGLGSCASTAGRRTAVAASRRRVRSLWAHDSHGRFSTRGRTAVATVRGTTWQTSDTCAGTRITVRQGVVAVRNLETRRSVFVHAGHGYLARRRHHGRRA